MEVSIKLEYRDKCYDADWSSFTDKEVSGIRDLMKRIAIGDGNYLRFKMGGHSVYFGEKILQESIITIRTKN